jgi:hypothetical protein
MAPRRRIGAELATLPDQPEGVTHISQSKSA